MLELPSPGKWTEKALCAQIGGHEFFPEKGESSKTARAICACCEVREPCLQEALDRGEKHGVWGGLSERQRASINKRGRKHCRWCGVLFTAHTNTAAYCSDGCRREARAGQQRRAEQRRRSGAA